MHEHLRDPSSRAKAAIIAALLWLAADFAFTLSALHTIWALQGFGPLAKRPDYDQVDRIAMIVSILLFVAMVLSVIMASRWIMRVNRNAQQWSTTITISPGWNVGWFFIPVASLFKPFQGIRQTWQASIEPANPDLVDVPIFMRCWWGLFLATGMISNASFRIGLDAETAEQFITVRWIEIASFVTNIPATILFIMLIRRLTAIQRQAILTNGFATIDG